MSFSVWICSCVPILSLWAFYLFCFKWQQPVEVKRQESQINSVRTTNSPCSPHLMLDFNQYLNSEQLHSINCWISYNLYNREYLNEYFWFFNSKYKYWTWFCISLRRHTIFAPQQLEDSGFLKLKPKPLKKKTSFHLGKERENHTPSRYVCI